MNKQHRVIA
jgi:hypothetical protein